MIIHHPAHFPSPRHSHHLRSHLLSLPGPFTAYLKLISFTNPFLIVLLTDSLLPCVIYMFGRVWWTTFSTTRDPLSLARDTIKRKLKTQINRKTSQMSQCRRSSYISEGRRGYRGGTAAAPLPFSPSDLALCGSHPLVTPYYCRLGDLLCFVCHYCLCI